MSLLSPPLRSEIHFLLYGKMMTRIPFFVDLSAYCQVGQALTHSLTARPLSLRAVHAPHSATSCWLPPGGVAQVAVCNLIKPQYFLPGDHVVNQGEEHSLGLSMQCWLWPWWFHLTTPPSCDR